MKTTDFEKKEKVLTHFDENGNALVDENGKYIISREIDENNG